MRFGWRVESSQQMKAAVTQMDTDPEELILISLMVQPMTLQFSRGSLRVFVSFLLESDLLALAEVQ